MRRNALLARTLVGRRSADVLMITGAREAGAFVSEPGIDVLTLPGLYKQPDGRYRPRRFGMPLEALTALRRRTIRAALEAFRPDLLIVDNVPRGALGELDEALTYLRRETATRCVLGLRDVLDAPEAVAREWARARNFEAIRGFYDAVWIYGAPIVYAAVRAYAFPDDIVERVVYTGYLDRNAPSSGTDLPALPDRPYHLCVVGGGQDGVSLAETFAAATLPEGTDGLIVTGPYMPEADRERLECMCRSRPHLHLTTFVADPTLLYRRAERVVAMGGYNTTSELLSLGKRALIVPRTRPRREQLIRARELGRLGLVDWLSPEDATPEALSAWLHASIAPLGDVREHIDMNGLTRIADLAAALVAVVPLHRSAPKPSTAHAAHR